MCRFSLLHVAAGVGATYAVNLLLKHGLDPNDADNDDGATALHAAALSGAEACVQLLIKAGKLAVVDALSLNLKLPVPNVTNPITLILYVRHLLQMLRTSFHGTAKCAPTANCSMGPKLCPCPTHWQLVGHGLVICNLGSAQSPTLIYVT